MKMQNIWDFQECGVNPEWLICVYYQFHHQLYVTVKQDNCQRMEDDLTHKLFDIIKVNKTIKDKLNNDPQADVDIYSMDIQRVLLL